jgi:GTP cyclohydrolase IA
MPVLDARQKDELIDTAATLIARLLDILHVPTDHNTRGTPGRVARMLIEETLAGCFTLPPEITTFPNVSDLDEVYAVGPIAVRSCCAHHLVPIIGKAWIAVLPGERLMGLSKFHRLTQWIMARPQMQEEATWQLANAIEERIKPKALAVVVRASHLCCTWRGVRDADQLFTTSVMRGSFRNAPSARAEVLDLFKSQGF